MARIELAVVSRINYPLLRWIFFEFIEYSMIRPFLIGEEGGRAINLSNIGYTTVNRGGLFNYTRAA